MEKDVDLALSGGGFRAVLFHLGVIGCLRDAGQLTRLRSVAAVSGGAILAGHLLVRWGDYTSPDTGRFASAATELIQFTQRGIRNRIVRRLPWIILAAHFPLKLLSPRWLVGSSSALLARYYDQYLFRGALLSGLEDEGRPIVRLVATNVTDAGLSCFSQSGYEFADVDSIGAHAPFTPTRCRCRSQSRPRPPFRLSFRLSPSVKTRAVAHPEPSIRTRNCSPMVE